MASKTNELVKLSNEISDEFDKEFGTFIFWGAGDLRAPVREH